MSEKQQKEIRSNHYINKYEQLANFSSRESDRMYYEYMAAKEKEVRA